jgi:glycerophosphoryl diester phosphodiesterase
MVSSRQVRRGVRLTSFDHEAVTTIGRSVEGLELGLRHLVTLHRGEEYARRHGATALHPMAEFASIAETDRARALGIGTHAWTLAVEGWPVDEGEQLDSAVRAGVDAVTVSSIALLSRKELS